MLMTKEYRCKKFSVVAGGTSDFAKASAFVKTSARRVDATGPTSSRLRRDRPALPGHTNVRLCSLMFAYVRLCSLNAKKNQSEEAV